MKFALFLHFIFHWLPWLIPSLSREPSIWPEHVSRPLCLPIDAQLRYNSDENSKLKIYSVSTRMIDKFGNAQGNRENVQQPTYKWDSVHMPVNGHLQEDIRLDVFRTQRHVAALGRKFFTGTNTKASSSWSRLSAEVTNVSGIKYWH